MKILKPTKVQLEHGLALHRNSIVIDTYGFQPFAAVDAAVLNEAINNNASPLEIHDLQEYMQRTRYVADKLERDDFENAWNASGVTCVFQNAGEEDSSVKGLLRRLAHFTYSTDMLRNFVQKAVTPEDIVQAKNENRHALYLSGNGVPLPQEWVSVEEELRYIRIFFELGTRMMHLTYNRSNMIGDGCGELANGGLSDFGKAVVEEMNRVGVVVDVAHSGWQTSLEAAKASGKPIVASLTAASLNEVPRSKPDNVIRAIADSDGFIGMTCILGFLGGSRDIAMLMKHIDYIVNKFGFNYVTIGTDRGYGSRYVDEENKKLLPYRQGRKRWESLSRPSENRGKSIAATSTKENPEANQSMSWTNWPIFTVGLVQMGYSDNDIQKILGGNALRVARQAFS